jgi:penicillin-insensitive murein endopeptidase
MGVFSRRLGVWATCAAIAGAIFGWGPSAEAQAKGSKPAASAHRSGGKRAAVVKKPRAERTGAGKSTGKDTLRASVSDAKDADHAKPAAKDAKSDAKEAKPAAKDAKSDAKEAKPAAKKEPVVPASSVGSPNEGSLVGGVKLGTADGAVRVVPAYQRGDTRWGLPALVKMLERSAKVVAKKHPGAVLGVGDISRKNGGDIFLHRSHESGRDADIAFYVTDVRGKNFLPDTFVRFEGSIESTSHQGVRFDVAKNWALVQAWLEDPVARVSHIFVADPLRRMLLAYAKRRVSPALYNRAALAMMQPSNALPHDNHFHVRISCPAEMKKSCVEYPAGVFAKSTKDAKKGKAKPGLVTPKPKSGTTAAQAVAAAGAKPKTGTKPAPARPSAHAQARAVAPKPSAQARAESPKRPRAIGAAPRAPAPEERLADFGERPKKPIYLQSATANNGAPNKAAASDDDPLDRVLFSLPALSHLGGADPDGDADSQDVKASVDDSGTVKITD